MVGAAVNPDVSFARLTQSQESDLEFLHRIAAEHNYDFTVRGQQIVFYSASRAGAASESRRRAPHRPHEIHFRAKTRHIYKAAQVSYQDPATKRLITQTAAAIPAPPTGDTLKIVARCENGQQASLKAAAALHRHNMLR